MSKKELLSEFRSFFQRILGTRSSPFVYVALGDSTAEGIGASHPDRSYTSIVYTVLKEKNPQAVHVNLGKKGATLLQMKERQLIEAIRLRPDLITISIGANDIRHRTHLAHFEQNLIKLIENLRTGTKAKIIINNIPDFSQTPAIPILLRKITSVQIQRFNSVIHKIATANNIIFIDLHTQSKIYMKSYPELISSDNFHPSDLGYALWASTILASIQQTFFSNSSLRLH